MNALMKPTLIRATILSGRRMATTTASKSILPKGPSIDFRKRFLNDEATYPLIAIMGVAMVFMTGMGLHAVFTYKDVRVDKTKRGTLMRNWGDEDDKGLIHTFFQGRYDRIKHDRDVRRTPDAK